MRAAIVLSTAFLIAGSLCNGAIGATVYPRVTTSVANIDRARVQAHVNRPQSSLGLQFDKQLVSPKYEQYKFPKLITQYTYFDIKGFGSALDSYLQAQGIAGYAVEIRRNGKSVYSKAWQYADWPQDGTLAWSTTTPMHVASLSKLVTAIAMVKLLYGLSTPQHNAFADNIAPYLPAYWAKGPGIANITFNQLLSHTSGLSAQHEATPDFPEMKATIAAGVSGTIGSYNYSNINYSLCRVLLPVLNGDIDKNANFASMPGMTDQAWDLATIDDYRNYVVANVLTPAGVTDATLDNPQVGALAYNNPVSGNGWNSGDQSTFSGAAGWHMSVDDMLNVMGTFRRGGSIVPANIAALALAFNYGLNAPISPSPLGPVYAKLGQDWDSNGHWEQSAALFLPQDTEIVLFVNSPIGSANPDPMTLAVLGYFSNLRTASISFNPNLSR